VFFYTLHKRSKFNHLNNTNMYLTQNYLMYTMLMNLLMLETSRRLTVLIQL